MEAVMGERAEGDGLGECSPGPAGPTTEAFVQRACQQRWSDPFEQPAAQPVGLDDPSIQRVVQVVGGGNELEVRPGALELSQALAQAPVNHARRGLLEQGPVVLAAAVPQLVGRVRVACEEQGTVSRWYGSPHVAPAAGGPARASRLRHPGTATKAVPASTRATQPSCGASGLPLTTAASRAVITAPMTSTAVTSTAGARDRAANQVET